MNSVATPGVDRIAFIGLGRMGRPMAAALVAAGFDVSVLDLDRAATEAFAEEHGARAGSSVRDAVSGSRFAILMVPDGRAVAGIVAQLLEDVDGVGDEPFASLVDGALIDMSSSAPDGTVALSERLQAVGIPVIDAPVSGGVVRAISGELSILIGGDSEVIDRCGPLFDVMGASSFRTGGVGSGHAMKALNNLMSAAGLQVAAEVLLIGTRFGLDPNVMLDVLDASTGGNHATKNKMRQFVLSEGYDSGFALELMTKDIRTALDLATSTSTPTLIGGLVGQFWALAEEHLPKGADQTRVVEWLEETLGTRLGEHADRT